MALVVGAAPASRAETFYQRLVSRFDLVVAADNGANLCALVGRRPDLAVGDFDSSPPGTVQRLEREGIRVVRYPPEKDLSDLDLAISHARIAGATSLTLTAAFSDRLDHTLAALGALFTDDGLIAEARDPGLAAWGLTAGVRPSLNVRLPRGARVGVLSPCGANGVTTSGLRYPLAEATIPPLASLGISNEAADDVVTVRVGEGRLLVLVLGAGLDDVFLVPG